MLEKNLLNEAIALASMAHIGQVDKGGKNYILHPIKVMMLLQSEDEQVAGVLHDIVEDSEFTMETLKDYFEKRGLRISENTLSGIDAVTHRKGECYSDYLDRIKKDPIGRKVKLADLTDNMNIKRIENPTDIDYKRLEKYKKAFEYLSE